MLDHITYILVSLVLLFAGAEALVRGSASLGLRAGLSPLVVGLTIVAFGTSSPELIVSIDSALAGQGDLAVGNVLGSNSFNIAVILGLTALICPIPVHQQILRIDAPVALLAALLLPFLLLNGSLDRLEGAVLTAGIIGYTWMNLVLARKQPVAESDPASALVAPEGRVSRSLALDAVLVIGGLLVLIVGSRLLVDHSVAVATALGVSEAVIGLTIVAAGTSMPELATSLVAALRKQPDIAIGNIIGSNVFNVLGILGVASLVAPMQAPGVSMVDVGTVILFTVLLLPLLFTGRLLHRAEGALLLVLYGGYLFWLWPDAG